MLVPSSFDDQPADRRTVLAQATGVGKPATYRAEGFARRRRRQWDAEIRLRDPPATDRALLVQLAGVIAAAADGGRVEASGVAVGLRCRVVGDRRSGWRNRGGACLAQPKAYRWLAAERWMARRRHTRGAERR